MVERHINALTGDWWSVLADYVQQFNIASLRPAVQQTYRGTPPPARRPVETYTARPVSADDYDDALIQGQVRYFFVFVVVSRI